MVWPIAEILMWVFVTAGSILLMIGAIGILRMPDFYSRIHPAGITDTMGAWLLLVGLMFASDSFFVAIKLVMLLLFLAITSPLASHALAKAAYMRGLKPLLGYELAREAEDD